MFKNKIASLVLSAVGLVSLTGCSLTALGDAAFLALTGFITSELTEILSVIPIGETVVGSIMP